MNRLVETVCFGVVGADGRLQLQAGRGFVVGPKIMLEALVDGRQPRLVEISIVYEPLAPVKAGSPAAPVKKSARSGGAPPPVYKSAGQLAAWQRGRKAATEGGEFSNPYLDGRGGFRNAFAAGWDAGQRGGMA